MPRLVSFSIGLVALLATELPMSTSVEAGGRGLLWRVVQTCVANHNLTGAAFPCLSVDAQGGEASGYAVLRAPFEDTHIIVTPTVRTIGIEAERLRGTAAPDYFQDAWASRHFVTDGMARQPTRDDLGLALNSRYGRSQDQLHIHVDCLRPELKSSLAAQLGQLHAKRWTRINVLAHAPRYYAMLLPHEDLDGVNPFDLVADGLKIDADTMDEMTIVVAGVVVHGKPGFVLLARQRLNSLDEAHGEALLDHSCSVAQ